MADVFGLQAMERRSYYTVRHGLAICDGKAGSGLSGKFEKSIFSKPSQSIQPRTFY
jgi:hypothetical protein